MNSFFQNVRTLSHVTPEQMGWRIWRRVRRAFAGTGVSTVPAPVPPFSSSVLQQLERYVTLWRQHASPVPERTEALRDGQLSLISRNADLTRGVPWQDRQWPMLWLYQLHACEWMRAAPEERVLPWIQDWIAKNPPGVGVGWHAYPLSLRLVHWPLLCAGLHLDAPELRGSLWRQIDALRADLEYDVRANHLWWNAAALVVAGRLLGHPAHELGTTLLQEQVREQVLPDGGHYERSPMYHMHVLEAGLITYAALDERPEWLRTALTKMAGFLEGILHPDGDIPLFGDSALGESTPPRALIALVREECGAPDEKAAAYPESGFYVLSALEDAAHIIAKAGAPGPSYQLGHAHGDVFSYELSLGGRRFIVDSGTHGYAESPLRAYSRSARAHNTVSVDGRDPLECWSAFRVGRRYAVCDIQFQASEKSVIELSGAHDGNRPAIHRRFFRAGADEDMFWVIDAVDGPRACAAESYIHFHPNVTLEQVGTIWRASMENLASYVHPFGFVTMEVQQGYERPEQGWYCPELGVALPAPVLVMRTTRAKRLRFGYALSCRQDGDWDQAKFDALTQAAMGA